MARDHYRHTLEKVGPEKGMLALIFGKAQNKFQDPAKLRRLVVHLIGAENWSAMSADVKGDAYTSACWRRTRRPRRAAPGSIYPTPFDSGDRRSVSVE
jgi:type I restriction enzyme M protein